MCFRKLLTVCLVLLSFTSFATRKYWVGGNATWDATAGTKWSTTSGGTGGSTVPTSSDSVYLDNATGTGNVTIGTATCKLLDCSGYINTLSGSGGISVAGAVTFVSGMTITATGTLTVNTTSTLTSNDKTWTGNITFGGTSQTFTLADNWTIAGNYTTAGSGALINSNTLNIGGNIIMSAATGAGSTVLIFNGTGTWSGANAIRNSFTINTAGTLTISGTVGVAGTLTYTAGTIASVSGVINISTSTTTVTLNASFVFTGGITTSIATTFNGTNGFTLGTFICSTAGVTNTFQESNTYTVTTALNLTGTAASNVSVVSSSGSARAVFVLSLGATQTVAHVTATRIDSSTGKNILNYKGNLTSNLNWNLLTPPVTVGYTF